MKGKRRASDTIPILSPRQMNKICRKTKYPRDACLIALLYLSGRRINEVLPLTQKDISITNNKLAFTTINEKSYKKTKTGKFSIKRAVDFKDFPGRKSEPYHGVVYYERIRPRFSLTSVSGKLLGRFVTKYLETLQPEDYLFAPLRFSNRKYINHSRAYQILRALDDRLWLHALRHINFTRLADLYKEDPLQMHDITFHKQFKSTTKYIHRVKNEELLEKI